MLPLEMYNFKLVLRTSTFIKKIAKLVNCFSAFQSTQENISSRFLSLKRNTPFIFAVDQLSFILEKEKVKTIIKIEDHESKILPRLKKISRLRERVILLGTKIPTSRSRSRSQLKDSLNMFRNSGQVKKKQSEFLLRVTNQNLLDFYLGKCI